MIYNGIFFINNALSVNKLSVFNNQQRFEQTLETLDSIDRYCPGSAKFIFDASPNEVDESYLKQIAERDNTWFLDMGKHESVQILSLNGHRSLAETYSFMGFLDWFDHHDFVSNRIYKISGRYKLTDDFIPDHPSYKGAFVFADALDSWMDKSVLARAGVDKLYRLRLWHMDYDLLNVFRDTLPQIFDDCSEYGIDVEHSYYKNLHTNKVVQVPKIGVTGIIAPSGEFIDE